MCTCCRSRSRRIQRLSRLVRGKVFFVTGGGGFIGQEICSWLAQAGAVVVATDFVMEKVEAVQQRIRQELTAAGIDAAGDAAEQEAKDLPPVPHMVTGWVLDCADQEACKSSVHKAVEWAGRLDGIIFTHQFSRLQCVADIPEEMLHDSIHGAISGNVYGVMYLLYYGLPHIRQQGGYVGFTSSISSYMGSPKCGIYCASKGAVEGFLNCLRHEEGLGWVSAEKEVDAVHPREGTPQPQESRVSYTVCKLPATNTQPMRDTRPTASEKSFLEAEECGWRIIEGMMCRQAEVPISGPGQPASLVRALACCWPSMLRRMMRREMAKAPLTDFIPVVPKAV